MARQLAINRRFQQTTSGETTVQVKKSRVLRNLTIQCWTLVASRKI